MAGCKFRDEQGRLWEVRVGAGREWTFRPVEGELSDERVVERPGYETDPFELTEAELRRLLHSSSPRYRGPTRSSPFKEDDEG